MSTSRPRHFHAVTGLVPLTAWLLWELWRYQQALISPDALAAAGPDGPLGGLLTALVLGALAFHGGYGIVLASRRGDNAKADPATPDTIREHPLYPFYRRSTFCVVVFVLAYGGLVYLPRWRGDVAPADTYDHLVQLLSSTDGGVPIWAMVFALGWALMTFHVGFGWFAATERWRPRVLPGPRRMVAIGCALAGRVSVRRRPARHPALQQRHPMVGAGQGPGTRRRADDEVAPTALPPGIRPAPTAPASVRPRSTATARP